MKRGAASFLFGIMIVSLVLFLSLASAMREKRPYVEASSEAARWIRSSAIQTEEGITWPAVPGDQKTISNTLYSGTPGVVLFFLETFYATGDEAFLEDARAGADYLIATLEKEQGSGLYVGISGIGFALQETFKATQEKKYRAGVQKCVHYLKENAVRKGAGVEWDQGAAGIGLWLLHLDYFEQGKKQRIIFPDCPF